LEPPEADWEVTQEAFGGIDTFAFVLDDPTNAITLANGKEVVLEKFDDASVRYFGGTLTQATGITVGIGRRFVCAALGWLFELSRVVVNYKYRGKSDQYIITDATEGLFVNGGGKPIQKDLSAYTVTTANVEEANGNTQIMVFNGEPLRSVMDTLANWAGFVWGVTPLQVVYYRAWENGLNTQSLSDAPDDVTSFPYYTFRHFRNFTEMVNAVYIYGGYHTVEDQTRNYKANGTETSFVTPENWRAPDDQDIITVEKNTGTDPSPVWTAQTVGIPQEEGSFDVVWHETFRSFEFTTAPSALALAWRVNGNIYEPVRAEDVDQPSIDANGRFEVVIKDSTLRDEEAAELRAETELRQRASDGERISLVTTQDGFEVGKLATVVNSIHGVNGSYLIDKMSMRPLGGSNNEYEMTLRKLPA